jgi:hypothetical protein
MPGSENGSAAGLRAALAQGPRPSRRRSRGLVVLLFDLPFELPHCLSVSPHNAKSRVPHVTRIGDPGFCSSPRSPNISQTAACSQRARAAKEIANATYSCRHRRDHFGSIVSPFSLEIIIAGAFVGPPGSWTGAKGWDGSPENLRGVRVSVCLANGRPAEQMPWPG